MHERSPFLLWISLSVIASLTKNVVTANRPVTCGVNSTEPSGAFNVTDPPLTVCDWYIEVRDTVQLMLSIEVHFPPRDAYGRCSSGFLQFGTYDYKGRKVIENILCGEYSLQTNLGTFKGWFISVLNENATERDFSISYDSIASRHDMNTLTVGLCLGVAMPFIFIAPAIFYFNQKKKRNPSYIRKQELREIYRLKKREQKKYLQRNPTDNKMWEMRRNPPTLPPFSKDSISPESVERNVHESKSTCNDVISSQLPKCQVNGATRNMFDNAELSGNLKSNDSPKTSMMEIFFLSLQGNVQEDNVSTNNLFGNLSTNNLYEEANRLKKEAVQIGQATMMHGSSSFGLEVTKYEDMSDTYSRLSNPLVIQDLSDSHDGTYLSLSSQTPILPPPPPSTKRRAPGRTPIFPNLYSQNASTDHSRTMTSTPATTYDRFSTPFNSYTGTATPDLSSATALSQDSQFRQFASQPVSQSTPALYPAPVIKLNDVTLKDQSVIERSSSSPSFDYVTLSRGTRS